MEEILWILFFVGLTFIILYTNYFGEDEVMESNYYGLKLYRYTRVNPTTYESSVGFIRLPEEIPLNDFITYEDYLGSHILISDFDLEECCCHATCYCEEYEEYEIRRRSSPSSSMTSKLFTKPLFYLVAAISSTIAVQKAKAYFDAQCESTLSESCPSSQYAVHSQLEGCDCGGSCGHDVSSSSSSQILGHTDEQNLNPSKPETFKKKYMCTGHCLSRDRSRELFEIMMMGDGQLRTGLPTEQVKKNLPRLQKASDNFGCEKLEVTKEIREILPKYKDEKDEMLNELEESKEVIKRFIEKHLNPFCEENSLEMVEFFDLSEVEQNMCTGSRTPIPDFFNPSVKCVKSIYINPTQ